MDLLALTAAILAALGLDAGPRFELSVALVQAVTLAARAADVPADVALALCARASRLGLDDVRACGCGRRRDAEAQAACVVRRLVSGHRRCGTFAMSVGRALSGRCRGGLDARRSVHLIRERIAPALATPQRSP